MRTADEAKLWFGIFVFPDNGIVVFNSFKLCVVNDIFPDIVRKDFFTLKLCFGSEVFNVIKTDCSV